MNIFSANFDRATSLALIVLVLLVTSYIRNELWHDRLGFCRDTVAKSPLKARAHNNLGQAYSSVGFFSMARSEYLAAILLDPEYAEAHLNLGLSYLRTDELYLARSEFRAAAEKKPDMVSARNLYKYTLLLDAPR